MWANTKPSSTMPVKKEPYAKKASFKKLGSVASKGEAGAAMKMFDDLFGDKK